MTLMSRFKNWAAPAVGAAMLAALPFAQSAEAGEPAYPKTTPIVLKSPDYALVKDPNFSNVYWYQEGAFKKDFRAASDLSFVKRNTVILLTVSDDVRDEYIAHTQKIVDFILKQKFAPPSVDIVVDRSETRGAAFRVMSVGTGYDNDEIAHNGIISVAEFTPEVAKDVGMDWKAADTVKPLTTNKPVEYQLVAPEGEIASINRAPELARN